MKTKNNDIEIMKPERAKKMMADCPHCDSFLKIAEEQKILCIMDTDGWHIIGVVDNALALIDGADVSRAFE